MQKNMSHILWFIGALSFNFLAANEYSGNCIEFSEREVYIPKRLGDINLYKDRDGFHVIKNDEIYDIQNCFCDQMLRSMSDKQLETFLGRNKPQVIMITPEELDHIDNDNIIEITGDEKNNLMDKLFSGGYIVVNQMSDGEYSLQANMRLRGGTWGEFFRQNRVMLYAVGGIILCMFVVAAAGAAVLGASFAAVAYGAGCETAAVISAAWLGGGIGGALGGVVGGYVGLLREINRDMNPAAHEEPPVNAQEPAGADQRILPANNIELANAAQRIPPREIPPIRNPFREQAASAN